MVRMIYNKSINKRLSCIRGGDIVKKLERERLSTAIDPKVRRDLEIFKINKGFKGVNEAIEYLTKKYIPGGFENENNNNER